MHFLGLADIFWNITQENDGNIWKIGALCNDRI